MPSRKQRRRREKSRRHEYEYVYVDDDGQEVEVDPEEVRKPARSGERSAQPRGARGGRKIEPPSWQRAAKRAGLLGIVVFFLFSLSKSHNYPAAALLAVVYTALFVPFTFAIDRFAYRRWQARQQQQPTTKR